MKDDLISRSELLEHKTLIPGFIGEYVAVSAINEAPTVDAVEVVRCRECREYTRREEGVMYCRLTGRNMSSCDFCSRGERKEDG